MSKIDELIAKLCPNGVEYKKLGQVGEFIRGSGLQKKDITDFDNGFGAIHYGQIYTYYSIHTNKTKSFVASAHSKNLKKAKSGNLVIATTSENDTDVCKAVAWLGKKDIAVSGDACIYRHSLEPKYVAYFFQSEQFQLQKLGNITGTKVRRVSPSCMAKFLIPVPPLEIQREIVKVLDTFTKLEAELKAELEAELEARRRQYHYYRDQLLNFEGRDDVQWMTLGEIGTWYGGGTPSKSRNDFWENGTIPWVSPKDMGHPLVDSTEDYITEDAIKNSSTKLVPANSVAVVVRSSILDKILPIALIPIPVALNQDMKAIIPHSNILPRFVAYTMRARGNDILRVAKKTGGSVASIESNKLFSFRIPVPPLEEQARIVAILDKFDALVNDLSSGLPAEIAARRKQYEHYRDRLLTFKEAQ